MPEYPGSASESTNAFTTSSARVLRRLTSSWEIIRFGQPGSKLPSNNSYSDNPAIPASRMTDSTCSNVTFSPIMIFVLRYFNHSIITFILRSYGQAPYRHHAELQSMRKSTTVSKWTPFHHYRWWQRTIGQTYMLTTAPQLKNLEHRVFYLDFHGNQETRE